LDTTRCETVAFYRNGYAVTDSESESNTRATVGPSSLTSGIPTPWINKYILVYTLLMGP